MRPSNTFTATLKLDAHSYEVTFEYEPPEPDAGLAGGWAWTRIVDAQGVDVDDEVVVARERSAGFDLSHLALHDELSELAIENEPSLDEADFGPSYDEECGFDPYLGGYSDDC